MARHTRQEGPDKAPLIDCYGTGEDLPAVEASSRAKQLPLKFHGAKDHLDDSMHEYKVRLPVRSTIGTSADLGAVPQGVWGSRVFLTGNA